MPAPDPDGSGLLTGPRVGELLAAAVEHAGGRLAGWSLDHLDAQPGRSTTATYQAVVDWPFGRRDELVGVSARASGPSSSDGRAEIFADGDREVAVWIHPHDPELPGLARAAYADRMAELVTAENLVGHPVRPDQLRLTMVTYRPRRRAVLRLDVADRTFYVKVLRPALAADIAARHQLLRAGGVPAPEVVAATDDHLLVLAALPGRPMARAIFDTVPPCSAEEVVRLLDALPPGTARLERRAPWSDSLGHYADIISGSLPDQARRLDRLVACIEQGLADIPLGDEPTHGDFHEGQLHVAGGQIVGLLDVDTCGPGRRADDLACLVAHLSTVQRMNARQAERVAHLLASWLPVFESRVDPVELRLRAAAVVVSLATGPRRAQEPDWQASTRQILDAAETLVGNAG